VRLSPPLPQQNNKQSGEQDRSERAAQSKNRELIQPEAKGERAAQSIVRDLDQRDANGSTDGQAHKPGRDDELASLHGKVIAPSAEREKRHE
jgi:hypothetical protein